MQTWDIAKLFVQNCNSPEDVSEVIATLQDPDSVQQVCAILITFSNAKPTSTPRKDEVPAKNTNSRYDSYDTSGKVYTKRGETGSKQSFREESVGQLESVFRGSGMTNKQVEQWLNYNFGVQIMVSKDSLRKYLARVMKIADLGLSNHILAAAQRLGNGEAESASDIRDHWDKLDSHSPVV